MVDVPPLMPRKVEAPSTVALVVALGVAEVAHNTAVLVEHGEAM